MEEEPGSVSVHSDRVMNMDDRDKAGDPDSNPEIDESESIDDIESSKVLNPPAALKHATLSTVERQILCRSLRKMKTNYIENFRDPDENNSVLIDVIAIDMGQRLAKTMADFQNLLRKSDKQLSKVVTQVEKNNVI